MKFLLVLKGICNCIPSICKFKTFFGISPIILNQIWNIIKLENDQIKPIHLL